MSQPGGLQILAAGAAIIGAIGCLAALVATILLGGIVWFLLSEPVKRAFRLA